MTFSHGEQFTTKDKKNDKWFSGNCAQMYKGGFWFGFKCARCNPNGLYKPGEDDVTSMHYYHFKNGVGLFSMEMKLKRLE